MQPQPALLDGPDATESDPFALLVGYLDWYRDALVRKTDGLTDDQLRTPLAGVGWAPLGLVQHLGWVERRWFQWGFRAEPVRAYPEGGDEWTIAPDVPTGQVWAWWRGEVAKARAVVAAPGVDITAASRVGGRFPDAASAPGLARILFHVYQEYARHLGHLDIVRQLLDGAVGE